MPQPGHDPTGAQVAVILVNQPTAVGLATANPARVALHLRNLGPAALWYGGRDVTPGGPTAARLSVNEDRDLTTVAGWYGAVIAGAFALVEVIEES